MIKPRMAISNKEGFIDAVRFSGRIPS